MKEPPRQSKFHFPKITFGTIIDGYLVKKFIPPFFLTFFLCLLIILMQFLWKYVDDLVGKGLEWYLILELLFYASATFVSLALPLAVLLSSLMTFGNLGEKYEIVAMKSAGISVMRLMRPLAFIAILITAFSFWFSESVVPVANVKLRTLLYEIREQKPTLSISEGVFYDGLGDYTIRIGKKNRDNERIEDVLIYDHSKHQGNVTGTYAKRGTMTMTPDKKHFILTLYDGYFWDETRSEGGDNSSLPFFFAKFDQQYMRIDLSSFEMQKVDESFFKSSNKAMKMRELSKKLDTMAVYLDDLKGSLGRKYFDQSSFYQMAGVSNPDFQIKADVKPFPDLQTLPIDKRLQIMDMASMKIKGSIAQIQPSNDIFTIDQETMYLYEIEWHRKIVMPLACLLFFFIGAPLGTIIRKGGIGVPLVVTVVFFAFYFVISIIGEKMAKSGDLTVWIGMWLSTFILAHIGVFLTYKATNDSAVLSPDAYDNLFKKIKQFFHKKHENTATLS